MKTSFRDLDVDSLTEIAKNFKSPLDIAAFEQTTSGTKYAVEISRIYRSWEKRHFPNDNIRIMATEMVDRFQKITFFEKGIKCVKIGQSSIKYYDPVFPKFISKYLKGNIFDNNFNLSYDLLFYIYQIMETGKYNFEFEPYEHYNHTNASKFTDDNIYSWFGLTSKRNLKPLEDFKYPNEKYRILSTVTAFTSWSIFLKDKFKYYMTFEEPYVYFYEDEKIYPNEMSDYFDNIVNTEKIMIAYYLFENGWMCMAQDKTEKRRLVSKHNVY